MSCQVNENALTFQEQLEISAGIKLQLKINNNRSTMLSVKWEPDHTKVSLHRMFLKAPKNIMEALACYLKGENRKLSPSIKAYIESNVQKMDYSHHLDFSKLQTKGDVYDLEEIYRGLNEDYFGGAVDLFITWFGERKRKNSRRVTFGLFHDPLRLIKINRLLDDEEFPPYFVAYVVYHEMLHHVCPTQVNENGFKQIHSEAFKKREAQFEYFKEARRWLRENEHDLFNLQ
ncbi:MAG: hypothetical protein ACH350_03540 [Parachlamydiaceae bacterium]